MKTDIVYFALIVFISPAMIGGKAANNVPFQNNYDVLWGDGDHVQIAQKGHAIRLVLDQNSGGGFGSKLIYSSGFFVMRIKLPQTKDVRSVLPTFYLKSPSLYSDEIDIEFFGSKNGFTVSTNIYTDGYGGREQQFKLWFDPSAEFHSYGILWNAEQIGFFIDDIPIRVYRNVSGIPYPRQPMRVQATIWEAKWLSEGESANWAKGPFIATYMDFELNGCPSLPSIDCSVPGLWWNRPGFWKLNARQWQMHDNIRSKYMTYDYCKDASRHRTAPPECDLNL